MTCGLVHASYRLPEWQAVKLSFLTPWTQITKQELDFTETCFMNHLSEKPCNVCF